MKQKIQLRYSESYEAHKFYENMSESFILNIIQDECLINSGKDKKFFSIKKENKILLFSISELDYYYLLDKEIIIEDLYNDWEMIIQEDTYYVYNIEYTLTLFVKEEI